MKVELVFMILCAIQDDGKPRSNTKTLGASAVETTHEHPLQPSLSIIVTLSLHRYF